MASHTNTAQHSSYHDIANTQHNITQYMTSHTEHSYKKYPKEYTFLNAIQKLIVHSLEELFTEYWLSQHLQIAVPMARRN